MNLGGSSPSPYFSPSVPYVVGLHFPADLINIIKLPSSQIVNEPSCFMFFGLHFIDQYFLFGCQHQEAQSIRHLHSTIFHFQLFPTQDVLRLIHVLNCILLSGISFLVFGFKLFQLVILGCQNFWLPWVSG